jgi:hypothetical protein
MFARFIIVSSLLAASAQAQSLVPVSGSAQDLGAEASLYAFDRTLPLNAQGGALDLRRDAPLGCLSLSYACDDGDGQRYEACLVLGGVVLARVPLPSSGGHLRRVRLWLPGWDAETAFDGGPSETLLADGLRVRSVQRGSRGSWDLRLDGLRLDLGAEPSPAADVARAFGCSAAQVEAARALGLPEAPTWALLMLQAACACPLSDLTAARATQSWGEIAAAHGLDWGRLQEELWRRARAAGLRAPESGIGSWRRVYSNQAFEAKP